MHHRALRALSLVALVSLGLGCIASFEEAKLAGGSYSVAPPSSSVSPEKQKRCDHLDSLQVIFGGTTLVLTAAAGSSGLVAWRVRNEDLKEALVVSAGAAGLLAVGTGYIWDSKQKQWVREGCGS
jgi:hypothetical protein